MFCTKIIKRDVFLITRHEKKKKKNPRETVDFENASQISLKRINKAAENDREWPVCNIL